MDFAVLVPLIEKDGEFRILFEVRSPKLKSQPGEVCFPGGAVEDGRVRVLYDQSWQRIGDCAAGAETVFLLEIAPLPAEGCAELRVLGPLEASSLLTEDAAGAEVLLAWRVAALEAIP